jgi:pimeloyl-ACP methyl ester carboxylesterase
MGLGAQMIAWDEGFCEALAEQGHYVIRFDNRDCGLSTKFDAAGTPDMQSLVASLAAGETPAIPYTLDDMADDAVALLDHLNLPSAHICGASMGGMIVQTVALRHPERVRSLTSIYSSTGDRSLPQATPEAMAALTSPVPPDLEGFLERSLYVSKTIGSPGFPFDEVQQRTKATRSFERGLCPEGTSRQMVAIIAHGDRTPGLRTLTIPTLVIHGTADPLIPLPCGEATAAAIPGAELLVIEGMGHDLPRDAWPQMVSAISGLTARVD